MAMLISQQPFFRLGTLPASFDGPACAPCGSRSAARRPFTAACSPNRRPALGAETPKIAAVARHNVQAKLWSITAAAALASVLMAQPASAAVAELFMRNCAGCHAGGGNVVQAGATLSTSDLKKNGVADSKAIYDLIYGGTGKMPGYGKDCAPRGKCTFGPRLPDEEIQQLADYTLEQAAAGWK